MQGLGETCELCGAPGHTMYEVPGSGRTDANSVNICGGCEAAIAQSTLDGNYWRFLADKVWNEHAPIQVLAVQLLKRMPSESWARDLLDQVYLDDSLQAWANYRAQVQAEDVPIVTVDSNGAQLNEGDSVTLIKDLDVKGANFTAKRGTLVKGITLSSDPKYVEGKVNGMRIVLVAAYLKKATS